MYRDGSYLISVCIVGLVLYGAALGLFLPEATVAVEPEEAPAGARDVTLKRDGVNIFGDMNMDLNLVSDEVGCDPDLPTNYTVTPLEDVGPDLPK